MLASGCLQVAEEESMGTSPIRHMLPFAYWTKRKTAPPQVLVPYWTAARLSAMDKEQEECWSTLDNGVAYLGRLGGGPMTGRSWAARCPELFAPGPDGCGGGGGATSLGRSAFCAAPAARHAYGS